jgi:drug/metabolite transporter (DMT)-like permease
VRARIALVYAVCCLIWGSTWAVIKVALADAPPFRFAATRMLLACLLLTPLCWRQRGRWPSRNEWRDVALIGFAQIGVSYGCIFVAEQQLSSSLTAVLFATFPVWTAVIAHFALPNEPLTAARLVAALLALVGAAAVESPALGTWREAVRPMALLPLAAAAASAFGNVWMKKRVSHLPGTVNLWGQTLVGGGLLLALSLGFERGASFAWTSRVVGALGYLTLFGTLLTFLALFWLIPRVSIVAVGIIPVVDTLVAVCLGVALLGEPLTLSMGVGAALILAAAVLANPRGAEAAHSPPRERLEKAVDRSA